MTLKKIMIWCGVFLSLLGFMSVPLLVAHYVDAADGFNEEYLGLLPQVQRTVAAYNAKDEKAFFNEFSKSVSSVVAPDTFEHLYVNQYFAQFGKVTSIEPIKQVSQLNDKAPLLIFDAVTEKIGNGRLTLSFRKETEGYRVMQFQLSR